VVGRSCIGTPDGHGRCQLCAESSLALDKMESSSPKWAGDFLKANLHFKTKCIGQISVYKPSVLLQVCA
jgi:hypothetical protein